MSGWSILELCMLLAERKFHRGFCGGMAYDGASWALVPPFRRRAQ